MTTAPAQAGDREAIEKTIQTYVDGGMSGKGDDMKPAFHDGATIYGYIGPDLFSGPILTWKLAKMAFKTVLDSK